MADGKRADWVTAAFTWVYTRRTSASWFGTGMFPPRNLTGPTSTGLLLIVPAVNAPLSLASAAAVAPPGAPWKYALSRGMMGP